MSDKFKTKKELFNYLDRFYFGMIVQELYREETTDKESMDDLRLIMIKPTSAIDGRITYQKDVKVNRGKNGYHYKIKLIYVKDKKEMFIAFWGKNKLHKLMYLGDSLGSCNEQLLVVLNQIFYNEYDKLTKYYKAV